MKAFNLLILITLASCSWTRRQGVNFMAPMLESGVQKNFEVRDWEYFSEAAPGNLLLLDSLLATSPENKTLLEQAIKSHFGYAFGVQETLHWAEVYSERENKKYLNRALYHYSKAIEYGEQYLNSEGMDYLQLKKKILTPKKIQEILEENLGDADRVAMFYLGAAYSSSLNLQRNRSDLLTLMPLGKAMIDWACEDDPNMEQGLCSAFDALYLMSRPKMLGGNPNKGLKVFKRVMKTYPQNALLSITFLQYYSIPRDNQGEFKSYMKRLKKFFAEFSQKRKDFNKLLKSSDKNNVFNLFNAIAEKRYTILNKYRRNLFE